MDTRTIFRLKQYAKKKSKARRYPTFRVGMETPSSFFDSLEDAERMLNHLAECYSDAYCWVLSEIPLGINHLYYESFSERIYLPDGQLWSERSYADMQPGDILPQYGEIEFDNYLYGRNFFAGRRPEEIRFQPGDIIEVFCYDGNNYWSDGFVELAIVVDTPPTVEIISELSKRYLKNGRCLTGDRGFDLGIQFNARYDAYTIVPAYISANTDENPIDYCPTHCAMLPEIEKVSARMRNKLETMRATVMNNKEWQKKFITHRLIKEL